MEAPSSIPQSSSFSTKEEEKDVSNNVQQKITEKHESNATEDTNTRPAKRQRSNIDDSTNTNKDILDICEKLKIKGNTRLEMKWEVNNNDSKLSHWWGAVLQEWDGRLYTVTPEDGEDTDTKEEDAVVGSEESKENEGIPDRVTVPLRKLLYDPYPDGGYPEVSTVESCFLSPHALYDLEQRVTVSFRVAGSTWEEDQNDESKEDCEFISKNNAEEELRSLLDQVLQSALGSNILSQKMASLTTAQQCLMGDKIADAKERLLQTFMKKIQDDKSVEYVITPDIVKACMQEVAHELQTI